METRFETGYHPRTLEVIDLVGDKWTLLVTYRLGKEAMRFADLRRQAEPISAKMLSHTLRRLESFGMVTRTVLSTTPPSVEYRLTELGGTFLAAASVICAWTRDNIEALDRAHEAFAKSNDTGSPVPPTPSASHRDQTATEGLSEVVSKQSRRTSKVPSLESAVR